MKEKEARRAAKEAKHRKEDDVEEEESPSTNDIAEESPSSERYVPFNKNFPDCDKILLLPENEVHHLLNRKRKRRNNDP